MDTTTHSEADMSYIRDFVQKIAEALVSATELPKQIELMKNDLDSLHQDLEKTKQRNIELDALVGDIRRQRDEAEQALSQVKAQLSDATRSLEQTTNETNGLKAQVEHFRSELEQAKRDRDDYGLKHMEAEDRAKAAEAKLAKLADALGLPKQEPKPEPPKAPEPAPTPPSPETTSFQSWANPVPQAPPQVQPEPTTPKRVYEGEPGFDMSKEKWDSEKSRYYNEA